MTDGTEQRPGAKPTTRAVPLAVYIVSVMTVGLMSPVLVGAASARFSDIPAGHLFYDEISWMEDTGVTTGYSDGTYRPREPVTRQSMAAFMQRLYDVRDDVDWAASSTSTQTFSTTFVDIPGSMTEVNVPPGTSADIVARFGGSSSCSSSGAGTWCSVRLMVSKDGGAFTEMAPGNGLGIAYDTPGDSWESQGTTRFATGDPGSSYRVKAQYAVSSGNTTLAFGAWSLVTETVLRPSDG